LFEYNSYEYNSLNGNYISHEETRRYLINTLANNIVIRSLRVIRSLLTQLMQFVNCALFAQK